MIPEVRWKIRRMMDKKSFKRPTGTVVIKNPEIEKFKRLFRDVMNFSPEKKVDLNG